MAVYKYAHCREINVVDSRETNSAAFTCWDENVCALIQCRGVPAPGGIITVSCDLAMNCGSGGNASMNVSHVPRPDFRYVGGGGFGFVSCIVVESVSSYRRR